MQTFRLLYFRENVLEIAEEVRVRDLLEAIEKAAGQPPDARVELWYRRVAIIGPSPRMENLWWPGTGTAGRSSRPPATP